MKPVGRDAFSTYHILYHYFKNVKNTKIVRSSKEAKAIISKFQNFKKLKNSPIVKKSTSQVSDIMLDACMQFENYPIKTVGEEVF